MITSKLKGAVRLVMSRITGQLPSSHNIEIIGENVPQELTTGWQEAIVAERQEAAFAEVLSEMRRGRVREDFAALAAATRATRLDDPLLIEIGSGSGWNHGVLEFLLKRKLRYIPLDYSRAMAEIGKKARPEESFVLGDAACLPFTAGSCDVLILGTVLMHVLDYVEAIRESRRVTKQWCIFHTIPVLQTRSTTLLRKQAYGVPVVEITFNEREFLDLLSGNGFQLRETFQSIPHRYLDSVVGERVAARTYLCEAI